MEASHRISLTASTQEILQQQGLTISLLEEIIGLHADAIAYMLQAYYPREKISMLKIRPESITLPSADRAFLTLEFIKEEFSTCSAIDTVEKDQMKIKVGTAAEGSVMLITAENWPEL